MAEDSAQDKTELPTARRLEKAREEGDVARSKELAMAMIMIASTGILLVTGDDVIAGLSHIVRDGLTIERAQIFDPGSMTLSFGGLAVDALLAVAPLLIVTFLISLATPAVMGGWVFSGKAALPKLSRLSLAKGFGRMFGAQAVVELLKAIAKFSLVAVVAYLVLVWFSDSFLHLGRVAGNAAFIEAGRIISWSAFYMCLSLLLIAFIDVPFQLFQHSKKLKMTLQEVKDEFKEVEGRPEVKAAIRQKQRELASQRMIDRVPDADVVIVNPQHYAVALSYDQDAEGAPIVVAKGVDHLSQRIREVATDNRIEIVRVPVLARAIYYTTDLNQEIPEPLYLAVAQVLSYVFAMNDSQYGGQTEPKMPEISVPDEFHFDSDGRPSAGDAMS